MNLTDVFIKRPVFSMVLSLVILLIGIVCYYKIPIRQFPEITATILTVNTTYPGASPTLMEGFVTTPIENAISAVNGIDYMQSVSSQGKSQITVQFKLNYDINTATADLNSAVSSARGGLPKNINDPIIQKQDPNAMPVVWISFISSQMSEEAITDYLQRVIQPRMQTIDGVSQAQIFGERQYAMRIWLDPQKMAAQNVTANDVQQALQSNNLQTPTGEIKNEYSQFTINANTGLTNASQFNHLVIPQQNMEHITRIQDVGWAQLGAQSQDFSAFMNGKKTIFLGIIPKSTGNPLAVATDVNAMLKELKPTLPKAMQAKVVWDNSKFIAASISEVKHTIIEATIVVILIIFLFLGSLRTLIITAVSIPLSLIGVFGIMALLGFTINTLTLLALVLAIGMVVDDAIVVSENIHRHLQLGKSSIAAAIIGAREIQFAIIAMTFTLAAVFAPIGFMSGVTGILFREFAFTLAGTVIISGFIALTLSPMMCSKLLRTHGEANQLEKIITQVTNKLTNAYQRGLVWVLGKRFIIAILMVVIFGAIYFLYVSLPKELAPKEDIGALITIVSGPANTNLRYTEKYSQQVGKIFESVPELDEYGILNGFPNGVNSAIGFLVVKPWEERQRDINAIIGSIFPQLMSIPGIMAFPLNPYSLPGVEGFMPINFVIETTGSYKKLQKTMDVILAAARQNPNIINVDTDLKFDKTDIKVNVDRNRAAILGISMDSIGTLLSVAFGEPVVSQFDLNGKGYDVIPQVAARFRNKPDDIGILNLRTMTGELVPLANIAELSKKVSPRSLNHFQQLRSATITASMLPGYTLGQALDYLKTAANKVMPTGTRYDFSGEARQFVQSSSTMQQTFIFALLFIFLVLAAQFESFRSPFVVMFTVPLATLGALLLLKLTGSTMNIYTEIGIVTLVGLITKHGILMVEFANQLQEQGHSRQEAIMQAAIIRFRPIVMTTMAMVLGSVPLVISVGAGAVSRKQMGWTIIGGMSIGTIFTLFVIPTMYIWFATAKKEFTTGDLELDKTLS